MKRKLFTDSDNDGVMCAIIGQIVFPNIDIEFCTPDTINNKVNNFLNNKEYLKYDEIYITDLSVNSILKDKIYDLENNTFYLIDHHASAINNFSNCYWASITIKDKLTFNNDAKEHLMCGAYNFYNHLTNYDPEDDIETINNKRSEFASKYNLSKIQIEILEYLIEITRKYDTYEWIQNEQYNKQENYMEPYYHKILLDLLGIDNYIFTIIDKIKKGLKKITAEEKIFILSKMSQVDNEIKKNIDNIITRKVIIDNCNYNIGIIFNDKNISKTGNEASYKRKDLDLIAIINVNDNKMSFRTIHDNIDVSKIAQYFNGGGHKKASGAPLPNNISDIITSNIFGLSEVIK